MPHKNRAVGFRLCNSRIAAITILAVLGFTAAAQRAMAQFTLSSELRSIDAMANFGSDDGSNSPGVFNSSVNDIGAPDMTGDTITSTAMASQNTDISTAAFSGSGSEDSSAEISGSIADSASASADSSFSVTFTVPVATAISLTGELDSTANASVSLDAFSAGTGPANQMQPFTFMETLQPGTSYTLALDCSSNSGANIDGQDITDDGSGGDGSYSFTLEAVSVPEPASSAMLFLAAPAILARRRRSPGGA